MNLASIPKAIVDAKFAFGIASSETIAFNRQPLAFSSQDEDALCFGLVHHG